MEKCFFYKEVCLYLAKGGQDFMYKYGYFTIGSQEFIIEVWEENFSMIDLN